MPVRNCRSTEIARINRKMWHGHSPLPLFFFFFFSPPSIFTRTWMKKRGWAICTMYSNGMWLIANFILFHSPYQAYSRVHAKGTCEKSDYLGRDARTRNFYIGIADSSPSSCARNTNRRSVAKENDKITGHGMLLLWFHFLKMVEFWFFEMLPVFHALQIWFEW